MNATVQRILEDISNLCADNPELAERTRKFLSGELPMRTKQQQIAFRLSDPLIERLEALVVTMNEDPQYAARGPWNRSGVIREAVLRGVIVLEGELKKGSRKGGHHERG